MPKLKKCPVCGREHREKKAALKCFEKKAGKQSWKWSDFGLEEPVNPGKQKSNHFDEDKLMSKIAELVGKAKPEAKKEFDEDKFFSKLSSVLESLKQK